MEPTKSINLDSFDNFYQELLILKTCIFGLCFLINELDESISDEVTSATSLQLNRLENVLKKWNSQNKEVILSNQNDVNHAQ